MGILFKYLKYSFLSKITFGKKKMYYMEKYKRFCLSEIINTQQQKITNIENHLDNIFYEFCDKYGIKTDTNLFPNILSIEDTINEIITKKKSISRFGDGEFRYILGEENLKKFYFGTDFSKNLQNRLII